MPRPRRRSVRQRRNRRNLGGAARAAVAGEAAAAEDDIQARQDAEKHAADQAAQRELARAEPPRFRGGVEQRAARESADPARTSKMPPTISPTPSTSTGSEVAHASDVQDEAERARQRAARLSAEADLA